MHGVEYNVERCNDAIHVISALSKHCFCPPLGSPERSAQHAQVVLREEDDSRKDLRELSYTQAYTKYKLEQCFSWPQYERVQVASV